MKTNFYQTIITSAALLVAFTLAANAQAVKSTTNVHGTVLDDQGKTMSYATVALLKVKDSSLVKGAISNDEGVYTYAKVNPGNYIVRVNVMGYAKAYSKPFTANADAPEITVPAIKLTTGTKTLKDVNVVSARPLIERKIDRTVMNVENSVLAAGNSALEILEKAPGVTVDKDDNISLKGKQGVTVMIDGKLTYLSAPQLASLLRSTDGNNIQSIEIITNPSAKYDAAGNSGIINIKLKKNKTVGTNGSLSLTGAMGNYPKESGNLSLNHKDGKFNIFGSYGAGNRKRNNDLFIDRVFSNPDGSKAFYSQHTFMPQTNYNNTFRLGADFDATKKNTIGFLFNGYLNGEQANNTNTTVIGKQATVIDSSQLTNSDIHQTYHNFAINLNDKYQIDTAGQELSVDLDYSKFTNTNTANYATYYFLANGAKQKPDMVTRNITPSTITINTAKADYTYPLSKTMKFEAGAKASDVKTDNDLQAQELKSTDWTNDANRTNHFIYSEKINAAYVNLSKSFKNTSVQVGLRAEDTHSIGDLVTKNTVDTSYLNFFPSVFLNQTLSPKHEIGFSYSRRIDRPDYENLNPFIYYLDPLTFSKGNPFIKPQYTQSFEFNYTYAKAINISLSYSYTTNAITQVILPSTDNDKKTYQTTLNLKTQNTYNININSPYQFTKWWSGNANLNSFYMEFKDNNLPKGVSLPSGQAATQFRTSNTFLLGTTYKGEIATDYQSPLTYGLLKIQSQYGIDLGISHSFANKKATIKLSATDIFNTREQKLSSVFDNQTLNIRQKNETRVTRLTFTYNFGNSKIRARQHKTGLEDEKSRVKTGN